MAIAFDVGNNGTYDDTRTATSWTWSHTCTGSDRALVVNVGCSLNADESNDLTGVTYGGVAMTLVKKQLALASANYIWTWILLNPASGANDIVVSATRTVWEFASASASYTGVDQITNPIEVAYSTYSGGTTPSQALTTTVDNSWVVGCIGNRGGAKSAGANTTERAENTGGSAGNSAIYDNNAAKTPAGEVTLNFVQTSDSGLGIVVLSLQPVQPLVAVNAPLSTLTLTKHLPTLTLIDPLTVSVPLSTLTLTKYIPSLMIGIWNNISKTVSSWVNSDTKHSSTFTNETKNSSTWNNESKS